MKLLIFSSFCLQGTGLDRFWPEIFFFSRFRFFFFRLILNRVLAGPAQFFFFSNNLGTPAFCCRNFFLGYEFLQPGFFKGGFLVRAKFFVGASFFFSKSAFGKLASPPLVFFSFFFFPMVY